MGEPTVGSNTEKPQTEKPWSDHFSQVSKSYDQFRPHYPETLYEYLNQACPHHDLAWDCATGTGQAALALANYFTQVIATDASPQQIAQAKPCTNVSYRPATAESSGIPTATVDLVTVAQALHWFDLDAFYTEVKRVLKPTGVLAVWSYGIMQLSDPGLQQLVDYYYSDTLNEYWPPQRRWVEEGYRSLPFPFAEEQTPSFNIQATFNYEQLCGYLSTWSATQKYRAATTPDPFPDVCQQIADQWPQSPDISINWPVILRLGRI